MASNTVIKTNVLALNSQRNLGKVGGALSKASSRLSSGKRINSAADDAAGLAISSKMKSQIKGLDQASRNAQDTQALAAVAEGGMDQMAEMVQRMRELAVQSANDTNQDSDRSLIQDEVDQLSDEIEAMAGRVEYNGMKLLDGNFTGKSFQIGANSKQEMNFDINSMKSADVFGASNISGATTATTTAGATTIKVDSQTDASKAIDAFDGALKYIADERSKLGAVTNRLEYTNNSLQISSENLSAAESRISDADMAKEMMSYTSSNVLQQAATSMLAQANQAPNNVLSLLN